MHFVLAWLNQFFKWKITFFLKLVLLCAVIWTLRNLRHIFIFYMTVFLQNKACIVGSKCIQRETVLLLSHILQAIRFYKWNEVITNSIQNQTPKEEIQNRSRASTHKAVRSVYATDIFFFAMIVLKIIHTDVINVQNYDVVK